MNRTIGHFRIFFLVLFTFGAVGVGVYQFGWARPQKVCEAKGRWWDGKTRTCGVPVWLPDLTGRPAPEGVRRPVEQPR